jgi:hypothetical protein
MLMNSTPSSKDTNIQSGLKIISFIRNSPYRQKQTLPKGEREEEDIPSQWPLKSGRSNNTYIR